MLRICKKCGFENDQAGAGIEAACPKCGAIYAKTDILTTPLPGAQLKQSTSEPSVASPSASPTAVSPPPVAPAPRPRPALSIAPVRSEDAPREGSASGFEKFLWILTLLGASLGAMFLILVEVGAKGAPQEAAGAAIAIAMAVLPYCMARAVQQYRR